MRCASFIAILVLLPLAAGCDGQDEPATSSGGAGASHGAGGASSASAGGLGGAPPEPVPGLHAEYFDGYTDLVLDRIEPGIDAVWGAEAPAAGVGADRFSVRWMGTLVPVESGTYTIATETDDGVRLWIDDQLAIDDWHGHFVTRNEATVELEAGVGVPLRLDYFEIDLDASARLLWSSATLPEEVVPTERLLTDGLPSGLSGPKPPYTNPVIPFDCPDPGVIDVASSYYAVCTGGTFPIRASKGLVFWEDTGAAILPDGKPPWAANGFRNWAPEIHQVGDAFVAYFTTVNGADVLSIAAAQAPSVVGPFTVTAGPLVEHPQGVIDATFFEDEDGSRWLLYKIDGNSVGQPTPILGRQLADDGLSFAPGAEVQLLVNDGSSWEGGVIEAPWVVKRDGTYFVFYSGNVYDHRYRTGVARSASLLGPYEKHGAPILGNNERWVGPGHGSVVHVGAKDYFVYHAWTNAGDGTELGSAGRQVLVDRIDWADGWPVIHDGTPSRTPQPWPGED